MIDSEIDQLRRELKIAAEAARKLSVAMDIAWAVLTKSRGFAAIGRDEGAVGPLTNKSKLGDRQVPLSFPEDPFE